MFSEGSSSLTKKVLKRGRGIPPALTGGTPRGLENLRSCPCWEKGKFFDFFQGKKKRRRIIDRGGKEAYF